uniref:Uncharacterized protein n=1 Tax=Rhodnius prolixus TaxID=13249 RepID=T1HGI3_RHOPR
MNAEVFGNWMVAILFYRRIITETVGGVLRFGVDAKHQTIVSVITILFTPVL